MEKTINDLIDLVTDNEISDIFVHGYIEKNDDILSFHPMMDRIYIEMGNKFIEIDNDQDNFYMYIDVVHEMNPCFELDDDDELGISSLLSLLIIHMISELNIVELNLYDVSDLGGKLICSAIKIGLENGEIIFIDSTYYDGIKIGGNDVFEQFVKQRTTYDEKCLLLTRD